MSSPASPFSREQRAFLAEARSAVVATIAADGALVQSVV